MKIENKTKTAQKLNIAIDVDTLKCYSVFAPGKKVLYDPVTTYTIPKLLELFEQLQIKATFFVIANFVKNHKKIWQYADKLGHEIASHSKTHFPALHSLARKKKLSEIVDSKKYLEDCIGKPIFGFRSPAHNIDQDTLTLLMEAGYKYDSSLCPGWYPKLVKLILKGYNWRYDLFPTSPIYNIKAMALPVQPFRWALPAGNIFEIPSTTTRFKLPFLGTIHLNTPPWFFKSEVNWLKARRSFITYGLHPIEMLEQNILEDMPWVKGIPGVCKRADPWLYLKWRLELLKQIGDTVLLKDVSECNASLTYPTVEYN